MLKYLALLVAGTAATPLCLPPVSTTYYNRYQDKFVERPFTRPVEYRNGDFLKIFIDEPKQKSLVYIHEESYSQDPDYGVLTDYTQGKKWTWKYDAQTKKVYDCQLEQTKDKLSRVCVSDDATKRGDLFLGKDLHVDAYDQRVEFKKNGVAVEEEIETLMEYGSVSIPVNQKIRGKEAGNGEESQYFIEEDWYNFSADPIPEATFNLPSECASAEDVLLAKEALQVGAEIVGTIADLL